jgi:MFS family permease
VDRGNISTAAPFIRSALHLSNTQLGLVLSAFAIPYAFFQIFGGWLADHFGPRRLLTVVGVVWALATVFTGAQAGADAAVRDVPAAAGQKLCPGGSNAEISFAALATSGPSSSSR